MQADFDKVIDRRGTDSLKWDGYSELFGSDDLLPLWVADSDWPAPQEVIDAIKDRADHGAFGYTRPGAEMDRVIVDWVERHYDWTIEPEWLVYTSGIVPAINAAVKGFTDCGDDVIIQSPVYYPFFAAIKNNGANLANNQLVFDGKSYQMDFADLEEKFQDRSDYKEKARVKMMILCNPHNPVGRVWTRDELTRLGEICLQNNTLIVSDEIHADLIYKGQRHIPIASLSPELAENSITMIAPSKTFNLAGLHSSVIIIPNREIRERFEQAKDGLVTGGNVLGYTAMKTAYSKCDGWLEEQMEYLQENLEFALDFFATRVKGIEAVKPEGTYLLWLDCRSLKLSPEDLNRFMVEEARVALDAGTWFGPGGEGFMRLNMATSREILREALLRIKRAVDQYMETRND